MTYYGLTERNVGVYTLPTQNTGVLLKEDGFALTTEDGTEILIENPIQDPNLTPRNVSAYSLPNRS